jgi:hypothetical protein
MTPVEREAHIDSCIVRNPDDLPEEYRRRREVQDVCVLARGERLRGRAR